MKWTVLAMTFMMLICTAECVQLTLYPGTDYSNPGSPGFPYPGPASSDITFSTTTSGGAPEPEAPASPESQRITIPSEVSSAPEGPTAQEGTQILMKASQEAAYAPSKAKATATSPAYNKMIIPSGGFAPNKLYISYAPRTIASCNLYANLPLWMSTSAAGNIWFYEWYPSGMLDTQYGGYVSFPGWYKRWFFADAPGWHILQYYCGGWSNYAYIYVYGYGGGYWVNPNPIPDPSPYPYPYWDSQITYTYPPTGHTYYSYHWSTTAQNRKGH